MKLLCVSHPCVTPINQTLFERVQEATGWDVSIVLPLRWTTSFGATEASRLPGFTGTLLPTPVIFRGNVPLHVYRTSLGQLVKREAPDVLYVHHEPYALASAQLAFAASRRPPMFGFYSAQNLNKHYPWPIRRLEKFVFHRAEFAFPVSATVDRVLRAKGFTGRTEILPLWVDTRSFTPSERNGRSEQDVVIGFAGRLTPEKGVETMLEALAGLPFVSAVVAGDGPQRGALQRRAQELSIEARIDWRGYVSHSQMPSFYRDIDLLVVPSRSVRTWREQFGRVVIEALACGVPVLASDSGELPTLLSSTGGGACFPEGDSGALAMLIRRFAERPEERLAAADAGLQAVRERFSVDIVARRFADTVEEVLACR